MVTRTANDIAKLFIQNRELKWLEKGIDLFDSRFTHETAVRLTAKQFKWLDDVMRREKTDGGEFVLDDDSIVWYTRIGRGVTPTYRLELRK